VSQFNSQWPQKSFGSSILKLFSSCHVGAPGAIIYLANGDKRWSHQLGHRIPIHFFIQSAESCQFGFHFHSFGPLVESSHVLIRYIPLIGFRPTNNVKLNSYNKDSSIEQHSNRSKVTATATGTAIDIATGCGIHILKQ